MMTVIVTACAPFGLTVSDAKTEIMCLQTKGGGHVPFTVTATGRVYKHAVEFVYLGGAISADCLKCRGDTANPEGMVVLRTVQYGNV